MNILSATQNTGDHLQGGIQDSCMEEEALGYISISLRKEEQREILPASIILLLQSYE